MSALKRKDFPADFRWGCAVSSYQVEGAAAEDGRGPSIWDTFCRIPGKVHQGHNGDVACDQYNRYPEDLRLMAELGTTSYRFSIAWPRIIPTGSGKHNPKGIAYYDRLVDALLEAGIEPAATLYHWDLPQPLEDAGGWRNRDTAYRFADYARSVTRKLDDRMGLWMTLNEPLCSAYLGHMSGDHAPGLRDEAAAYSALHHLMLAHGLAARAYDEDSGKKPMSIAMNIGTPRVASSSPENDAAAQRYLEVNARMYLDPLYRAAYPQAHLQRLAKRGIELPIKPGDLEIIARKPDILGLNYYFELTVEADESPDGFRVIPTDLPKTGMGWDIVPEGLHRQLTWVNAEYGQPEIMVTENGCVVDETVTEDGVRDPDRTRYLFTHLEQIQQAMRDGVRISGYYHWSLLDNFEWGHGYDKRFGLIRCDFSTLERIPKESYFALRDFLRG